MVKRCECVGLGRIPSVAYNVAVEIGVAQFGSANVNRVCGLVKKIGVLLLALMARVASVLVLGSGLGAAAVLTGALPSFRGFSELILSPGEILKIATHEHSL